MQRKGRITRIEKEVFSSHEVIHGIKDSKQPYYESNPYYNGSNGSYSCNHKSETSYYAYITMYESNNDIERRIKIDIKDWIKDNYDMERISEKLLNTVRSNLEGKKIDIDYNQNNGKVVINL